MSRTYRHRHSIPKGFKAIDKNGDTIIIDENGQEIWMDDVTGEQVTWCRYRSKGKWSPGIGYETNFIEVWKTLYFRDRKVPVARKTVRRFTDMGWCATHKEWRAFADKASRRAIKMALKAGEWDLLPKTEGKRKRWDKSCRRRYD